MIHISENFIIDGYNNRTILRDTLKEEVLRHSHYSPLRDVMLEANFLSEKPRRATGDGEEEKDWIPKVDKNGKVSYEMEERDSVETLQSQFGLTETEAKQIVPDDIQPGESVSGEKVKEVTGSEVLKLDLNSKVATEQRVFDQYLFAGDLTALLNNKAYYFSTNDFFTNTEFKPEVSGKANILVDKKKIELFYLIQFYNLRFSANASNNVLQGIYPVGSKQTWGGYFNGSQERIDMPMYHPETKKTIGYNGIFVSDSNANKLYKRLNRLTK